MTVTRETLVGLLAKHGGKLKKSDFMSEFKCLLESDDPVERRRRRDNFKELVNQVACVKVLDGVQHVVLKRGQRPLLDSRTAEEEENEEVEDGGGGELQQQQQQFHSNGRLGAGEAVPPSGAEEELPRIEEPGGATEALSPVQQALRRSIFGEFKVRRTLNFDMQNPAKSSESDDPVSPRGKEEAHSVGTHPDTNTGPAGSPKLSSRNSSNRRRPPPPPPPMSAESVLSSEPGTENRVPLMVPLEPAEHQWLVQCAAGRWNHVLGLLMQDSQMATKRDFTSGFTVLHWAAKCGDSRMLVTVLDLARQAGVDVNVDARSHGGYTPLHVAALHGQDYIVTILVAECGANVGARDNSGRRAYHYLRPGAAASLREMLGQPRVPQQERVQKQHREEPELLPLEPSRGRLHSISRLFQPHTAEHKRKHKQRPSISSSIFTFHSEDAALSPTEEKEEEEQLH